MSRPQEQKKLGLLKKSSGHLELFRNKSSKKLHTEKVFKKITFNNYDFLQPDLLKSLLSAYSIKPALKRSLS
jgi:hypothetical protein